MTITKLTETTKRSNDPTYDIIGCAISVHRELGPGLLESTYRQCLSYELSAKGFSNRMEVPLPVTYKGHTLDCGYRIDLLIEDLVIVELKAVESLTKIHEAQLLTYMRLSGVPLGLLMNFNMVPLKKGLKRFRYSDPLWS